MFYNFPHHYNKEGPSLRKSAGAKLIIIFRTGKAKPELLIDAFTLSLDSCTAVSGNHTIVIAGSPPPTSTSTPTFTASIPTNEAHQTLGNITLSYDLIVCLV